MIEPISASFSEVVHPDLIVLGYSEAAMFLQRRPPPNVMAILSIHGQREYGVDYDPPLRLDLSFDDVDVSSDTDPVAVWRTQSRRRWSEQNGRIEKPPTPADAAAIIQFAARTRNGVGTVLCHCQGGISRAPAAALICLSVWRGPGSEAGCVDAIRSTLAGSMPHAGLVRFADELLERKGRLIEAIAKPQHE